MVQRLGFGPVTFTVADTLDMVAQGYVIVNLNNRTAEIYTSPTPAAGTYEAPQVVPDGQSLSLRVGESEFFTFVLGGILP